VLNPLTSSDSDSLKSNGARCVSARVQISQGKKTNKKILEEENKKEPREKEEESSRKRTTKLLNTDS
jgi:hypothetical protein